MRFKKVIILHSIKKKNCKSAEIVYLTFCYVTDFYDPVLYFNYHCG